jgi:hypothetical protein
MAILIATGVEAQERLKSPQLQVAALALPTGARADWQQWDSFLTSVVKKLGEGFRPAQREQLADSFLDSRYQLVQALNTASSDPVPQLFVEVWQTLSPIVKQAIPGATKQTASQYSSFISAMDGLTSLSGIG